MTRPATATTGSASQVGRCAITAPAAVSATKVPSSQATARSGGSRRHQAWTVPPWLSATTMPSMIGNAARKGHENGSTATPNASVAAGVSSSQASAVSAAQDANERLSLGAGSSPGHASRSSATSSADLMISTTATSPANQSQDWLSVNSQRRSW